MIESYGYTNVGSRDNNEDYYLEAVVDKYCCYIVCDGLGGHADGEVASKFISEYLIARFKENPTMKEDLIESYVVDANKKLIDHVSESGANTTLTMVITNGMNVLCAHVGDSRIYCMNGEKIIYQSRDHSVPQMLVQMGEIREDEIRGHEDSNRLLRVMGMEWDKSKVEISVLSFADNEPVGIILCSDGFWEYILEEKMFKLFKKSKNPQKWMERMLKVVRRKANLKTNDNYTAITVMMNK